jgi:tetratricopeptide (TPR) repeat protein
MKADQRKELQRNDLAASIEKLMSGVSDGPSKNTMMYVTLVVVGVALLFTGYYTWHYFSEESKTKDSDRWEELNRINSANAWTVATEDLQRFADDKKNAGTPQARMARFELARYWSQSSRDVAAPGRKGDALANVKKGRDLYAKLVDESGDAPLLAQEALMGAARGSETLGEFDQARKHYEKLAKDYPQSVYGKDAAKQLERIKDNQDLEQLKKLFGQVGS